MRTMSRAPSVCLEPSCPDFAVDRGRCEKHSRIKRACDGCGRIIELRSGHRYCTTCRPAAVDSQRWKPYNNPRWRKLSARYRRLHPICERCRLSPSEHVDHKDGLGPDGPRGLDWANLRALCKPCHSRKTASRDGGFGNPRRAA